MLHLTCPLKASVNISGPNGCASFIGTFSRRRIQPLFRILCPLSVWPYKPEDWGQRTAWSFSTTARSISPWLTFQVSQNFVRSTAISLWSWMQTVYRILVWTCRVGTLVCRRFLASTEGGALLQRLWLAYSNIGMGPEGSCGELLARWFPYTQVTGHGVCTAAL